MKKYSLKSCEELIEKYVNEYNGCVTTIEKGCLGLGFIILHNAIGKKSIIIKEYFINSWNSGHNVTMYNKLPKKYQALVN